MGSILEHFLNIVEIADRAGRREREERAKSRADRRGEGFGTGSRAASESTGQSFGTLRGGTRRKPGDCNCFGKRPLKNPKRPGGG